MTTLGDTPGLGTYCPMCGYDLRASTCDRCSECGARVGRGTPSRIPWMHRQWRGRLRCYLRTVGSVVAHPGLFAHEWKHRLPRRDARSFYRITLLLHVLLVTGMVAAARCFPGSTWNDLRYSLEPSDPAWIPAFIFWDRWIFLIPVAIAAAVAFITTQKLLQAMLRIGVPADVSRRAGRVALYLSATSLWVITFLGIAGVAHLLLLHNPTWVRKWVGFLSVMRLAAAALAAAAVVLGSLPLALRLPCARKRGWPVVLLAAWALTAAIAFLLALPDVTINPRYNPAFGVIAEGVECGLALLFLLAPLVVKQSPAACSRAGLFLALYPMLWIACYVAAGAVILWVFGYAAIMLRILFA